MKNLVKAAMTAGAAVVLSLGALAVPGVAQAGVAISIDVAPPPPRVEVLPPPRVGYVWAPGHWEWVGGRHAWVGGVSVPASLTNHAQKFAHHAITMFAVFHAELNWT